MHLDTFHHIKFQMQNEIKLTCSTVVCARVPRYTVEYSVVEDQISVTLYNQT
jgi:hypothetical protein